MNKKIKYLLFAFLGIVAVIFIFLIVEPEVGVITIFDILHFVLFNKYEL